MEHLNQWLFLFDLVFYLSVRLLEQWINMQPASNIDLSGNERCGGYDRSKVVKCLRCTGEPECPICGGYGET